MHVSRKMGSPNVLPVLVADVEDIDGWFPELPLARKSTPMKVVDR